MTTPPAGVDFTPEAVEEARSAFVGRRDRLELAQDLARALNRG
jgi:hypothetical protein